MKGLDLFPPSTSSWLTRVGEELEHILFVVLVIQLFTWPPIHGFDWDVSILIGLESFLFFMLVAILGSKEIFFVILSFLFAWKFWFLLASFSWFFSSLIHLGAIVLAEGFGLSLGTSPECFRVNGLLVSSDPSKTASFALLFLAAIKFNKTLIRAGLLGAFRESIVIWPSLLAFGILRWLVFAEVLGWWRPDLVTKGWQIFWGLGLFISLLPILCFRFSAVKPKLRSAKKPWKVVFLVFFTLGILFFQRNIVPGFISQPNVRIAIDETHSKWEPTSIFKADRFDPILAENNYGPWLSVLRELASVTVLVPYEKHKPASSPEGVLFTNVLDVNLLQPGKFDLLILKCPTMEFSESEISAIRKYVKDGGLLWAIGEHTNVFFMNTYLNQIIEQPSSTFNSDGVCDHMGRWLVTGGPLHSPLPFAPSSGYFMWATGGSIKPHRNLVPLVVSSLDAFSDPWEPKNRNFFGKLSPDNGHVYGPFVLSGIFQYGKGKILLHGDSTNFNASMLSTPGKLSLTRKVMEAASFRGLNLEAMVLENIFFAILASLAIGACLKSKAPMSAWILLSGLCMGFWLGTLSSSFSGETITTKPPERTSLGVDFSLAPTIGLSYGEQKSVSFPGSLDALFVQLQIDGVGVFTSLKKIEAVLNPGLLGFLIAEPALMPSPEGLNSLKKWVNEGGTAILVSRTIPSGPLRSIALSIGLEESIASGRDGFPDIVSGKEKFVQNSLGLNLSCHLVGSGSVVMIENWGNLTLASETLFLLSNFISRNL